MNKREKRLLSIYRSLDAQGQSSVLDFAEFLHARTTASPLEKPNALEKPALEAPSENESVIAAIKRLQRSYKMLDTDGLFNEVSGLMSAHIIQGRPADEVIAELELLFDKNYQSYLLQEKQAR